MYDVVDVWPKGATSIALWPIICIWSPLLILLKNELEFFELVDVGMIAVLLSIAT
jgi:hypothetical protein